MKILTLRAKFMAAMALILATSTLLLVSNNIRLSGKFRQTASEIRLAELAPLLSSTLAVPVFERDVATLREKLTSVVAAPDILHVSVEDAQGEQLSAAGEAFDAQALRHRSSDDCPKVLLTTPISLAGKQIATASVLLSTDSLDTAYEAVAIESFLIGLSTTLIGVLALGLFGYLITRRLAGLEEAAVAVTAGDLSIRAPVSGHDEVAKVSRAFNTMLTRLRSVQEKLKLEKTQLEMAIQSVDAGLYDIRVDDSSVYRSQRLKEIIGVADLPGTRQAWRKRIHPDDVEAYIESVEGTQAGEIPAHRAEYRVRHDDGGYRWIHEHGKMFRGTDGETDRIVGLAIDITDQKETEIALQETREQLRALVNGLPHAIYMKDTEATTSAQPGIKRNFQHSYYPVKSDDGSVVGITCVVEDVTVSRRLADEQLAHAQKMEMVGQLAGGIAHDFNNLLAIIRGHLEILQEKTKTDPGTAKRLDAILRAARRGTDLTGRLLAIGRRQNFHADKVMVGGLLDDMVEVLVSALGSKIRVEVDYGSDLWPIRIDPGRLEDAILNIALNAGAAMPAGGRLDIRAANHEVAAAEECNGITPGKYVLLSMDDTGTGIPSHIRPRILEPFFTTKRNGTGLGLSVVHGFLRQSGGALTIESDEGQGTRVHMYLPCTPAANRPAGEKRPANSRKFALVVDDEPDLLALTEKLLRQLGYDTRAAPDAETALDLLARHPDTALLVTDVIFSNRLEGLALAHSARERIPGLPVILMSGHATKTDLGGLDGSTVFLRKPFGRNELADQLSRLLPQSSATTSEQNV